MIRYHRLVLLTCLWLTPRIASSQPAEYKTWTPAQLYEYGIDLLKRGRSYLAAINSLKEASEREPGNLDYQIALGHSYGARFASVAFARLKLERLDQERHQYDRRVMAWEHTHSIPGMPLFNRPPPAPPVAPATPDDRISFTKSDEDARQQLASLARQSLAAYRNAEQIAAKEHGQKKAESDYSRGWGLMLLRRFGKGIIGDAPGLRPNASSNDDSPRIGREEIVECFRACTKQNPDKAEYWQSLALALVPGLFEDDRSRIIEALEQGSPVNENDHIEEAGLALKQALKIRPGTPALMYELAIIWSPSKLDQAIEMLEKLVRKRSENAVGWYLLAERRFFEAERLDGGDAVREQDRAFSAIESGNRAPAYHAIPLDAPIAAELRPAWSYRIPYALEDALIVHILYSRLSEIGSRRLAAGDIDGVLRIGLLQMAFGQKVAPQYAAADLDPADPDTLLHLWLRGFDGVMNWYRGYDFFRDAQKQQPTDRGARLVALWSREFSRAREWEKAIVGQ